MSNYEVTQLTEAEARKRFLKYPYALVHEMSRKVFTRTEELDTDDLSEWIDARLFSESGELHYFRAEDGVGMAVEVADGADEDSICSGYALVPNSMGMRRLLAKQYIDYDEDGQAYVALSRLCGLEGGN